MEDKVTADLFDVAGPVIRKKVLSVLEESYTRCGLPMPAGMHEVLDKLFELNRYVAVNNTVEPGDYAAALAAYGGIVNFYSNSSPK